MNSRKGNGNRNDKPLRDQFVNAAPGDDTPVPRPPQNIADTQAWKQSQQSVGRMWNNYRMHLATAFRGMTRAEQENLVQRLCVIVTLGVTCLALLLFYPVMPLFARVFGVPALLFAAYWAGNRIVTPVMLTRLAGMLNDDMTTGNQQFIIRGPQDR